MEMVGDELREAEEWVLRREAKDGVDLAVFVDENHLDRLATKSAVSPKRLR